MSIGDLLELMPPHEGAGANVDWDSLEAAWGTSFPTDYKAFLEHYGVGTIEQFFGVFGPSVDDSGSPTGYMADETSVAQELWELLEGVPGVVAEADRILAGLPTALRTCCAGCVRRDRRMTGRCSCLRAETTSGDSTTVGWWSSSSALSGQSSPATRSREPRCGGRLRRSS